MRTKKKVIVIEKFKYDDDDHNGITLEPMLLLKLMEFAKEEAKSDEHLHAIVAKAHLMSHDEDCLEMEDYFKLIEPVSMHMHTGEMETAMVVLPEEAPAETTPA